MITKCRNNRIVNGKLTCGIVENHIIIESHQTDTPPRVHLKCIRCGCQFNKWMCDENTLREIYGSEFKNYL